MNERDIVRRLIADRQAGFVALVRWSSTDLFRGLVRLVRNRQAAEDLSQETYLRAWKALQRYSDERIGEMRLRGWLWTIAMNRARTHLSRAYPAGLGGEPVEDIGEAVAVADLCERLLAHLDDSTRTVVVLRHVVGLPYQEIGDIVGKPIGTVKSDVHRALRRMRETVEATHGQ